MTKLPDPWSEIAVLGTGPDVSARRVDPQHPHDFFWARDAEGRAALVLRYAPQNACNIELPALQGMEITERPRLPDEQAALIITLKKQDDREIFHRLCTDLIETARVFESEHDAVRAAVNRTWKWHALLKMESDRRLSLEEQQGLVGELLFLEKLLQLAAAPAALGYWRGPLGDPKDFLANGGAAEIKARQGGRPFVKISSEHQLDPRGLIALFLVVVELSPAGNQTAHALTLDELVTRVRRTVEQAAPSSIPQLDGLLVAGGYLDHHSYDDRWWLETGLDIFEVREGFPSVTPRLLPVGISETRYRLDLLACAPFATTEAHLFSALIGDHSC